MLRKYLPDPSHVIHPQEVQLGEAFTYEEVLVSILNRQIKKLYSKEALTNNVFWCNLPHEEATWEVEDEMRSRYPHVFMPQVM